MLTNEEIEAAIAELDMFDKDHENPDCINMAYEWLDAQVKTKGVNRTGHALKHLIENWSGRYVSTRDVMVAAHMHPEITGHYPYFNISSKLTEPDTTRLGGVDQAFTQNYRRYHKPSDYKMKE